MAWQHIVALGDSVTVRIGDPVAGVEMLSWADRLAAALKVLHPAFRYTNLAHRGVIADQVLAEQLPRALELGPDLVSVLIGGNDITKRDWQGEHFQKSMDRLLHALTQMGATVITMTMIDNSQLFLPHVPWPPIVYERLRSANTLIRKLSDTYGAICVDFESLPQMQPRAIFGVDRVHLNALGYLKVAAEVAHCLTRYSGILITGPSLAVPAERQP